MKYFVVRTYLHNTYIDSFDKLETAEDWRDDYFYNSYRGQLLEAFVLEGEVVGEVLKRKYGEK